MTPDEAKTEIQSLAPDWDEKYLTYAAGGEYGLGRGQKRLPPVLDLLKVVLTPYSRGCWVLPTLPGMRIRTQLSGSWRTGGFKDFFLKMEIGGYTLYHAKDYGKSDITLVQKITKVIEWMEREFAPLSILAQLT